MDNSLSNKVIVCPLVLFFPSRFNTCLEKVWLWSASLQWFFLGHHLIEAREWSGLQLQYACCFAETFKQFSKQTLIELWIRVWNLIFYQWICKWSTQFMYNDFLSLMSGYLLTMDAVLFAKRLLVHTLFNTEIFVDLTLFQRVIVRIV